jgi:N-acetylmuramic acid 6-phosphate (MurNAc-6-P) etherase
VLAGGAAAFVRPAIQAEDRPELAVEGMKAALQGSTGPAVALGISCGLSASFVHGMLSMQGPGLMSGMLLGFCEERDAVLDMAALRALQPELLLMNPIVGAEAVAGSVRMKCATASLLLLLMVSDRRWVHQPVNQRTVREQLARFSELLRFDDAVFESLGPQIDRSASALAAGRAVSLIGFDDLGLICVADAAECRATFNSAVDAMAPRVVVPIQADADLVRRLQALGQHCCVSVDGLREDLTSGPLKSAFKVFLLRSSELAACVESGLFAQLRPQDCLVVELCDAANAATPTRLGGIPHIAIPTLAREVGDEALVARSLVTMLTTVLWIRAGRVFGNRMINHRISVRKLFPRAVGIIDEHLGCGRGRATELLQRSIAGERRDLPSVRDVDGWVALASACEHVIPRAILFGYHPDALGRELDDMLAAGEGVRSVLARLASASPGDLATRKVGGPPSAC